MHLLERHVRNAFRNAHRKYLHHEGDQKHRPYFINASQLPYCGLRRFLQLVTGVKQPLDAKGRYYTHVGTATHTVLQEVFGSSGKILGNWECKKCKTVHPLVTKPKHCKKCKSISLEYVEIEVLLDGWLLGHIDGVFRAEAESIKGDWVVDYKTTSHERAIGAKKIEKSTGYVLQQRTYVTVLPKTHKIKPRGWVLIYVSRDNPFDVQVFVIEEMTKLDRDRHFKKFIQPWLEQHRLAVSATSLTDVKKLYDCRLCKSVSEHNKHFQYGGCQFKPVCVASTRKQTLAYAKNAIEESAHELPVEDNLAPQARKVKERHGH